MKKMKLNSLNVTSFATSLDKRMSRTAKGGNTTRTKPQTGHWILSHQEGCVSDAVSSVHVSDCWYSL